MAGIGFELRKIFNDTGLINMTQGMVYSVFTIVGPMIITTSSVMAMNILLGFQTVSYSQRDLLMSIVLYSFIFSLILTCPISAVLSRYIADKIYEEKEEDIMAGYFGGLLLNTVAAVLCCVPVYTYLVFSGKLDSFLAFASGGLFFALAFTFHNMVFVSALKEYKKISVAFLVGMIAAIATGYILYHSLSLSFVLSSIIGLLTGFVIISFCLLALIQGFFKTNSENYYELIEYIRRYKVIAYGSVLYLLGLYIHNFVYWVGSDLKICVAGFFRSSPTYDASSFLAMITNISILVIFTVRVETRFHSKYQVYCQELIGGTGEDIQTAKKAVFSTLAKELLYIVQMQSAFTIAAFLVISIIGPSIGLGGLTLIIYQSLAPAYLAIYVMYCMTIFLHYFDDSTGVFVSMLTFFLSTLVFSIVSLFLPSNLSGIGPFVGGLLGCMTAYIRLIYIEKNIDQLMFCRGNLLQKVYKT